VTNKATAIGTFNGKTVSSNEATATVTLSKPSLSLTKSASPETYSAVDQTITYTYVVTNTGNVPVTGLTISDDKTTVSLVSTIVDPGQSVTGTATYKITQNDINAGSVTNKATATGKYNSQTVNSNEATVTVKAVQNSALKLEKSASPTIYSSAGQTITYTYIVTNTGNVPVTGLAIADNKTTVTLASNTVDPGQSVTGTATYQITGSDISAGSVTNKATATGTCNGKTVNSNEATATVTSTAKPPDTQIPEFPSVALPVVAVLGIMFISQRRRKEK
jgi:uncharacterized repeat protein (TIGR01451 family)